MGRDRIDNRNSKLGMVRVRMGVQHLELGTAGMLATGGRREVVTRGSSGECMIPEVDF
jgi:hypothetical protein